MNRYVGSKMTSSEISLKEFDPVHQNEKCRQLKRKTTVTKKIEIEKSLNTPRATIQRC